MARAVAVVVVVAVAVLVVRMVARAVVMAVSRVVRGGSGVLIFDLLLISLHWSQTIIFTISY